MSGVGRPASFGVRRRATREELDLISSRRVSDTIDRHLALPWLSWVGVFGVACLAHVTLGRDAAVLPFVLMLMTAVTCGLTDLK